VALGCLFICMVDAMSLFALFCRLISFINAKSTSSGMQHDQRQLVKA
jgi:hypothetical protein